MHFLKRFFRHVWMSPLLVRARFPQATLDAIAVAVAAGEKQHRGQVRFVVEAELTSGQLWAGTTSRQRAIDVFSMLRVWDTEENNGVLLYVLLADRKVEIVADRGLNRHVSPTQWQALIAPMRTAFREGRFEAGLAEAVQAIDGLLQRIRAALPPGGLFLTRVGDASAGLPYHLCNWVDHAVTFVRGHRLPRLYCRPLAEWVTLLQRFGFVVETDPMNEGKPFANVMLVCRVPS